MSTNFLAQFSANLSTISAANINYSTLVGSTIIASSIISNSTINVSSITSRAINYSTLTGSTILAQAVNYSTLTGSTTTNNTMVINSTLTGSTMTVQTVNYSTLIGSTILAQAVNYSTLTGSTTTNNTMVVNSTLTGSTMTVQTVNYSTLTGSTMTNNTLVVNSTINVSSITSRAINYSTMTGSTMTINTLVIASTLINTSGNIGIGTTNPTAKLHIHSANNCITASWNTARADGSNYVTAGIESYFITRDGYQNLGAFIRLLDITTRSDYPTVIRDGVISFGTINGESAAPGVSNPAVERMRITGTGNVGIGTTSPSNLLTVGASATPAANSAGTTNLVVYGNINCSRNRLIFSNALADWNHCIYNNSENLDNEGVWNGMKFNVVDGAWFRVGNAGGTVPTTALYINSSGNIGIGTATTNAPLQFIKDVANRKIVLYEEVNNDHQFYGFGINGGVLRYQVPANATHIFYAAATASTSTELMRITSTGNVGIGTTNPNALLTSYGNSNLGSSSTSITTIAGTLNQISGAGGGPFLYQAQWDTASTSSRQIQWIQALNSYTGGPYSAVDLFNNVIGIITIYVRNNASTGLTMTQYLCGHGAGPTVASLISGTSYSLGTALFTSVTFDGASSGNFVLNTNQGGTSPSVRVCWVLNAAT